MHKTFFSTMTVFLFVLIGCGSVSTTDTSRIDDPKPYPAPKIADTDKQAYLDAINNARGNAQHCGSKGDFKATSRLNWNDALYRAAYEHDQDMIKSGIINKDHTGSNTASDYTSTVHNLDHGSTVKERITNNGYPVAVGAENLTAGTATDTPEKAVQEWLNSESHCAHLMDPNYKEVGMAHIQKSGTKYIHYWTQDFGTPKNQ